LTTFSWWTCRYSRQRTSKPTALAIATILSPAARLFGPIVIPANRFVDATVTPPRRAGRAAHRVKSFDDVLHLVLLFKTINVEPHLFLLTDELHL
jgi:hypothetical protein